MKDTKKLPTTKIRAFSHYLAGSAEDVAGTYLVAYRPTWVPRGLMARVSLVEYDCAYGEKSETPLGEICLSELRERRELARHLADILHPAQEGDEEDNWHFELDKFFGSVVQGVRKTKAPVHLRDVEVPTEDLTIDVDGWQLLSHHPTILFGDGESAKSMLALWVAGKLTQQGRKVLVLDWELSASDHRVRLQQLFGDEMPDVRYRACDAPLPELVEELHEYVVEEGIDFLILDSIAFACSGEAEGSAAATSYFTALKDIGVPGSLSIAHQTKNARPRDVKERREKPFGSVFWHNAARATWLIRAVSRTEDRIESEILCRKSNLMKRGEDVRVQFTFSPESVNIELTARVPTGIMSKDASVLAFVKANPGCSKNAIYRGVGGDKTGVLALVDSLVESKQLRLEGDKKIVLARKGSFSAAMQ